MTKVINTRDPLKYFVYDARFNLRDLPLFELSI